MTENVKQEEWPPPIPQPPIPPPLTKQEQALLRERRFYTFCLVVSIICASGIVWGHLLMGRAYGWTTLRVIMAVGAIYSVVSSSFYCAKGWRLAKDVAAGRRRETE